MSVQSDVSSIQYTGNGSAVTPYPVPFVFHEAVHIRVVVVAEDGAQTELRLGTEFSVAGAGSKTGGSVTTKTAVPTTRKLSIYREVPIVQQSKFIENGPLPASTVERTLDALTMVCQQLARKVAKSFRLPDASPDLSPMEGVKTGANAVMVVGEDGAFHLWSIQKLKEEIAAMAAVPPMLQALMVQYPVGCLYFTRRNENPRDILGFGTWRRFGAGRMIVSLDPESPELSTVDAVGGEAEHTLTRDELPNDAVTIPGISASTAIPPHKHRIKIPDTETQPEDQHTHKVETYEKLISVATEGGVQDMWRTRGAAKMVDSKAGSAHKHLMKFEEFLSGSSEESEAMVEVPEHQTEALGSGSPHNNMPPYIVVHVWTRINSDAPEEGVGSLPFPADPTLFIDRVTGQTRRLVIDDTVIGNISV